MSIKKKKNIYASIIDANLKYFNNRINSVNHHFEQECIDETKSTRVQSLLFVRQ